jgi:eukaryotic-like serine/threonine-protein kinase
MPTERWLRLDQLFAASFDLPAERREEFLERECAADGGLREEVRALLDAADASAGFLASSALETFARQVSRDGWSVRPGDSIGAYKVERKLGAGGMGEVWQARDERLGRDVAIKLLLPHPSNAGGRARALEREARAAGSLNHTNVLTVHDVGEHRGAAYLVTECLQGRSLRARLEAGGRLSLDEALDIGLQVARGLGAAHARGIVHRDLKPENLFLAADGRVKILDFGLATWNGPDGPDAASAPEMGSDSVRSLLAGTAGYMAPEQLRGGPIDLRVDLFALGAVLHEMLAGSPPFRGTSTAATLAAVLEDEPPVLTRRNLDVPPGLSVIVRRCLAKSVDERFASAQEVEAALAEVLRLRSPAPTWSKVLRRPTVALTGAFLVAALLVAAWKWRVVNSRSAWARTTAVSEARKLADHGDAFGAFALARRALDVAPDDPQVRQSWLDVSNLAWWTTEPAGAEIAITSYRAPREWVSLGRTPLAGVRVPRGLFRIRISKPGFELIQGTAGPGDLEHRRLDPEGSMPGMVRVAAGRDPVRFGAIGELEDFWMDRFEVTNREFREFVDQRGYERREFWKEPFVDGGRTLRWEEAVERFRDSTGMPGPATWRHGTFPEAQADLPVGGVSWYEAAAYAAFAGKSLPTMYHWYRAAALGRFADILTVSNFDGRGPSPVGTYGGLGPFGTYDMAGNLKEWCSTATDRGRFLLGGAWNEPRYVFADYDAAGPFQRSATSGFRLVRYAAPPSASAAAPVSLAALGRDVRARQPVSDELFRLIERQRAYDRRPVVSTVEGSEETPRWRRETIAIDAPYGGETMRAHLFLPLGAVPPYQTVIFFPAGDAFRLRSSRDMSTAAVDMVLRSGRAFLYPVYKGTYEREVSAVEGPFAARDLRVAWSRDLGRAIDYLETRADVDSRRLAYYGISAGADAGVLLGALEPRLRSLVLQGAGITGDEGMAPEIDPVNYAPRIRTPILLLNGRFDFDVPYESSQRPLFDLLGTPAGRKRHVVFETGHVLPVDAVEKEFLAWLDGTLGPVAHRPPA